MRTGGGEAEKGGGEAEKANGPTRLNGGGEADTDHWWKRADKARWGKLNLRMFNGGGEADTGGGDAEKLPAADIGN